MIVKPVVMLLLLCYIDSLWTNSVGDEGALALSKAMMTMTSLQILK